MIGLFVSSSHGGFNGLHVLVVVVVVGLRGLFELGSGVGKIVGVLLDVVLGFF